MGHGIKPILIDISAISQSFLRKIKKTKYRLEAIQLYVSSSEISMQKKYRFFIIIFLKLFDQSNCQERTKCNNKMNTKGKVWFTYKSISRRFCKDLVTSLNSEIHSSKECKFHFCLLQK